MIAFGGWEMPVQFTGILDEHNAVRGDVGVFDISHMGEIFVRGPGAAAWLQKMLANDLSRCAPGEGQYTFLLNHGGGVIDDLIAYGVAPGEYLLVVNAAKAGEDADWLEAHPADGVEIDDRSEAFSALAVQGPRAAVVYEALFGEPMVARNRLRLFERGGGRVFAAGTGYTGESGFEMFFPHALAVPFWRECLAAGAKPCGLGARDTLRLEMCFPLNGADLSPERTPLEAGLGAFVALDKPDFIGRTALRAQKEKGVPAKLSALRVTAKSPPMRPHYPVKFDGETVAETTSGALSPSLGCGIALAYLPAPLAVPGQTLAIEVRGRDFPAVVERRPFYKPRNPAASG